MDLHNPKDLVDHAATLDCIHCGLCLRSCPTYQLTGVESSSPRGRVHLMRAVAEGRIEAGQDFEDEMDFCLLCRHCESVCPAGVQFGPMMEVTRDGLERRRGSSLRRLARRAAFAWLLPSRWALGAAAVLARFGQMSGLDRMVRALLGERGRFIDGAPAVPPARDRRRLPAVTPRHAAATDRGSVWMLEGCVMPILLGGTNRATVQALTALGHEVRVSQAMVCCGSLHAHNGERGLARKLARKAIEAFEAEPSLPIVVNSAGCGAHLRELAHLFEAKDPWRSRAADVAARVRDFSEVAAPILAGVARADGSGEAPITAAWDAPCHLCHGQAVRQPPLDVLDSLPGVDTRPLADSESCCGSAGLYSLLRPDDSSAVLEPKLESLRRSGAQVLVTANPGCQLQWSQGIARAGLDVRVAHLAELVAERYTPAVSPES
ncbi:(Fe-S)-binding protein [Engelhardtia mirabilis]|uniref:Glycolate oxidase iron-sulfur subunit n=1 Tax=Engelhardtia mirabilis TaxID=2528011 RepID=A0A518BQN7_9BACT|nr:Lactate utilization protein A [Planctomycetes bacterium Pla133]QDV03619.1 Lactate utilization protein A [Planctomycetes bacterium Pla86]